MRPNGWQRCGSDGNGIESRSPKPPACRTVLPVVAARRIGQRRRRRRRADAQPEDDAAGEDGQQGVQRVGKCSLVAIAEDLVINILCCIPFTQYHDKPTMMPMPVWTSGAAGKPPQPPRPMMLVPAGLNANVSVINRGVSIVTLESLTQISVSTRELCGHKVINTATL